MIIIFASSSEWLYLGRFLAGVTAGGFYTLVPVFVTEISQDNFRGHLGSFFLLSVNSGMLLMYIAGNTFDYYTTPKLMLLLPALFLLIFIPMFYETPVYLFRKGKVEAAEKSLMFYRNCKVREELPDEVENEIRKMISKVNSDVSNSRGLKWNELSKKHFAINKLMLAKSF